VNFVKHISRNMRGVRKSNSNIQHRLKSKKTNFRKTKRRRN